jgi:hypothetical protein
MLYLLARRRGCVEMPSTMLMECPSSVTLWPGLFLDFSGRCVRDDWRGQSELQRLVYSMATTLSLI